MPTYEYRCPNGHDFERFQKMSDDPVDTCPECGADAVRLLSGGAGLLFKGSGFYITDSRDSDYQKSAKSDADAGSSKSSDALKSSDSSKSSGTASASESSGSGGKGSSGGTSEQSKSSGGAGATGGGPGSSSSSSESN